MFSGWDGEMKTPAAMSRTIYLTAFPLRGLLIFLDLREPITLACPWKLIDSGNFRMLSETFSASSAGLLSKSPADLGKTKMSRAADTLAPRYTLPYG